jgi:hypothetical protein
MAELPHRMKWEEQKSGKNGKAGGMSQACFANLAAEYPMFLRLDFSADFPFQNVDACGNAKIPSTMHCDWGAVIRHGYAWSSNPRMN